MPGIQILDVDESLVEPFFAYAHAYGAQHDGSYLTPEERARFTLESEPAVIALDENNSIVGVASLMLDGHAPDGSARFRVLHALYPEHYPVLVDAVLARTPESISRVFLLLPERAGDVQDALSGIGFGISHREYVLRHLDPHSAEHIDYLAGTHVQLARADTVEDWAAVANAALRKYPNHAPITYERAAELLSSERALRGGTLIAYRGGVPVGVVLTMTEASDPCAATIETLAVVPEHQGMGLGRALLHDAVSAVGRYGCRWVTLSVSTFSRRAVALYLDSGFRAEDIRVCWERRRA